LQPASRNEDNL